MATQYIELPDGNVVAVEDEDMAAFEQEMLKQFPPEQPAAEPIPEKAGYEGFLKALAGSETEEGGGDLMRGLAYEAGRLERGIKQFGATPEEKLALAQQEKLAREEFAVIDEGIGLEDAGELAFMLGSLALPGGAPVQVGTKGLKLVNFFKNLPTNWGGVAILSGLLEGMKGRTEDESTGGQVLGTMALTAAGGVAGNKVGQIIGNRFDMTGAGKGLAATLGATVGARDSKRIFREGIFRRISRALTGREKNPMTDPVPRAMLRRGGQEDSRMARAQATAAANEAGKRGVDIQDIEGFLDEFPAILKSIRPLKANKEAGKTTAMVRDEARTMFALLQEGIFKPNPDGSAYIDIGALRKNYNELLKSPNFTEIFSGPKQKQLAALVENYSRAALGSGKDVARVEAPFEKAMAWVRGEREAGLEEVEAYFASMMGKQPSNKYGNVAAVAAWMAQNELDPAAMLTHFTSEGWLGQLELFETIAEQVE